VRRSSGRAAPDAEAAAGLRDNSLTMNYNVLFYNNISEPK
jgi:hypothetical protein